MAVGRTAGNPAVRVQRKLAASSVPTPPRRHSISKGTRPSSTWSAAASTGPVVKRSWLRCARRVYGAGVARPGTGASG